MPANVPPDWVEIYWVGWVLLGVGVVMVQKPKSHQGFGISGFGTSISVQAPHNISHSLL